ncbi:putative cation exchanger C3A12.06c [Galendromus occidentalis]|uniref:Cation exchanger C3A12.06c n=1 Tax=Galendromus occidentalis TaxID=34638 RepID=A0AAJ6VVT7_9ACAR|nr:putative cation exchanger C3A12.06c [Galendromus occidentalis]
MYDVQWLFGFASSNSQIEPKCSDVWEIRPSERCSFVRSVKDCRSGEAFLDYVELTYCKWESSTFLPLSALFVLWGSLVYVLAGNYVTSALVHLKERFNMNEIKAGATLLTLGNGLPDIMGAVTAVQIGHEGLLVGEVLGGTLFVVGVIVGSLYTVGKNAPLGRAFCPMLCFFVAAVVFVGSIYLLGRVTIYHIIVGLALYVSYYVYIFSMSSHKECEYELIADETSFYIPINEKYADVEYSSDESSCLRTACCSCMSVIACVLSGILSLPFTLMIPTVCHSRTYASRVCDANQFRFFMFPVLFMFAVDIAPANNATLYISLSIASGVLYRIVCCTLPEEVVDTLVTFAGFILSLCFLHQLTAELIAVVRAMGICFKLTDEVMGLSILTYGNFLGDISTYVAIVNRGCLQMALTGCISSVLMSLLLNTTLAFSIRFAMTGVWYSPLMRSPVTTILMGSVILCPVLLLFSALTFRCHSNVCSGVVLLCYYGIVMCLLVITQL